MFTPAYLGIHPIGSIACGETLVCSVLLTLARIFKFLGTFAALVGPSPRFSSPGV
jgi:hypothetical protein